MASRLTFALGLLALSWSSPSGATQLCEHVSCLGARDVNGIQLDMTLQQVTALAPNGLNSLGRGQYTATISGISYDLGFTPLGHLFRIDSHEPLGYFAPDRNFGLSLSNKLATKYGVPETNQLPDGPAFWDFAMPYTENSGTQHMVATESLSAVLTATYKGPVSLDMKLMDFRILRRDEALLNNAPQREAQSRVHF